MYSVGIDLGGTFTKLAAISADGRILGRRKLPAAPGLRSAEALAGLGPPVREMTAEAGLPYPPPNGIGIGIPGIVDHRTGWVTLCGPLAWRDVPAGDLARSVFGCEVAVDIDVAAGALSDLYLGCAREASNLLYVSWGTGIGCGVVISRRLYHSRGGAMYELGHAPADPSSPRRCYCGCMGCLEVEAGGKAMVEQASARIRAGESSVLAGQEITAERIAGAARSGDPLARRILDRSAVLIARVLAGVLALLNPDTVVFGGGVSRCWPLIRDSFDHELRLRTPSFCLESTAILQSTFGDAAGVVGAALLPLERKS